MTNRSPGPPMTPVLSRRALNRASLERQLLLRRDARPALAAVEHLVGLQAQATNAPYLGLWARLEKFGQADLTGLLENRSVVRSSVLRGTQHVVSAADYRWLRPLVQPVLDRARQAAWGRVTAGLDLAELADSARSLLRGRALTRPQLRDLLAERWPDQPAEALGWSAQCVLALVHPPPSGTWGRGGATPFVLAEEWLDGPLEAEPAPAELVRRYLAAFGPASVQDLQTWSGLTRLREVVEPLRSELRTFRDEAGKELFDLADAVLPDPETPAPVRLLPEFDNLIVAHADRTRIMTVEHRRRVCVGSQVAPTVLIDGEVAGSWKLVRQGETATLTVEPFLVLSPEQTEAVAVEAGRMLDFAAADAERRELEFAPAAG